MRIYFSALLTFCLLFFASCEKNIQLNVNAQTPKLVVDASIENNQPPYVVLSHSLNYFSSISPDELQNSFVRNAIITVSNGAITDTLKEYEYKDTSGYTLYYYTIDFSSLRPHVIGAFNTAYNMKIIADGEEYETQTLIPDNAKRCDSLWWQPAQKTDDTSLCVMMGAFYDPPGLGNYGRYFTKRNSENFLPGLTSVFDDQVVDGKTFSLQFDLGWNKNNIEKPNGDDYGFARRGDTITLKYCNINKAAYDFWNTWEFAWQAYGNPFSSPVKVLGNVSNNALGAFSGYAVAYKTIIIPK